MFFCKTLAHIKIKKKPQTYYLYEWAYLIDASTSVQCLSVSQSDSLTIFIYGFKIARN